MGHASRAVGWLCDDRLRGDANAHGKNCWILYVAEILDELGLCAAPLTPETTEYDGLCALLVGDLGAGLPEGAAGRLGAWVRSGGILVGFASRGLDEIFGIAGAGPDVPAAPFTVGGWMFLDGRDEAAGLLDEGLPKTLCPIMSPLRRISTPAAATLTEFSDGAPAITSRRAGKGRAFYFAFNLPQAIWTYHQGRPITEDSDGDGYLRTGDAIIVGEQPTASVPCADMLLLIIENMIAPSGVPFVHQLPPLDGGAPDALFHYGGDDEAGEGLQAEMSRIMKSLGLPYHLNVMLGRDDAFHFTDEDAALYAANGHEFSLHFNFIGFPEGVVHPAPISEAEYDRQLRRFVQRYGRKPVCANTHFVRASGWADLARFGAERGVLGDNSLIHHTIPPMDPVNLFGCPFGTVYPFFVYDDAKHGNGRLNFASIPIGFYEPGSYAREETHPLHGQDPFRPDEYRRVVDLACRYGWTLNIFSHPSHMQHPGSRSRDALRCMLDRIGEIGARVVHVGSDALCLWWHARSRTAVTGGGPDHCVTTDHPDGVLLRFLESALPERVRFAADDGPLRVERRERSGRMWLYVHLAAGRHPLWWSA